MIRLMEYIYIASCTISDHITEQWQAQLHQSNVYRPSGTRMFSPPTVAYSLGGKRGKKSSEFVHFPHGVDSPPA